jgi:hypothetical protein
MGQAGDRCLVYARRATKATSGIARCSAILQVRGLQLRDFVFTHLAGLALAREDPHGFPSLGYAWTTDQRTAAGGLEEVRLLPD